MTGVRKFVLVMLFSLSLHVVDAQPPNPQGNPDPVPITGLEILVVGGATYGIAQLRRKRNSKKAEM